MIAVGLGILGWPRPAFAHAVVVRAVPPDRCSALEAPQLPPGDPACASGVILTEPPTEVHLWFSEPVHSVRHGLIVVGPSGRQVEQGAIETGGSEIKIKTAATEPGTYQVYWQIVADDTHPVRGGYTFSLGQPSALPAQTVTNERELGSVSALGLLLQVAGRWLHFLGYALGFGPVVLGLWGPVNQDGQARLWRLVGIGILLLIIAEPIALLGQTASLRTEQLFDPDVIADILASSFGRVLAQRLGAALLLWVLVGAARQGSRLATCAIPALGLATALLDGQASHAVSSGPLWPGLIANTIHLAAMGVWLGGLAAFLSLWPSLRDDEREPLRRQWGRLAGASLIWLVGSGSLMAWLHLVEPDSLLSTSYGRALSAKLVLLAVSLLLALCALRRFQKHRFRLWQLEGLALTGLIALAGLLVSLPPPA